ncbi:GNAT family N-acetyltransferase [Paenibacillus sp. SI8]|uniref:GNAT family N-acetyltransferase n=1 Tax=unclassified Paenibacillus TaxID=185978 RepID=UPI003466F7D5
MMNIQPLTLEGTQVTLMPLQESHISELTKAANDPLIWAYMTPLPQKQDVQRFVRQALEEQQSGLGLPFSVYDKGSERIVGSTRLFEISTAHRQLEIGHTWYHPTVWRTRINTECKYLLLRHCFETLGTVRVQLKTDLRNVRSQTAIARLGAVQEGILRQHRILQDGYIRDTVMFSIIASEWPEVKQRLEGFLSQVYV